MNKISNRIVYFREFSNLKMKKMPTWYQIVFQVVADGESFYVLFWVKIPH